MTHADGMRMNHVEVTVPVGSFAAIRKDLVAFYGDTLGFGVNSMEAFGPNHVFLTKDAAGSNFIYVAEHEHPMIVGGDDHVGFHVPERAAVDAILADCRALQARDPRMQIRALDDLLTPQTRTHAFYFRYLLPLWFDIQCVEMLPG
jgi:catechol 2,3-dioxygenase-like lactoylglutathione lyase family enzyme